MKIFLLVNSFPSESHPSRGVFNLRFVKQMIEQGEIVHVVFFRIWMPGRKFWSQYNYQNIEVTQLCLPLIPGQNYLFLKLNTVICSVGGWLLMRKRIKESDVIHSVYLTTNSIAASTWARRLNIPHIAQAIGSDVNSDMKKMVKTRPFKRTIKKVDGIITNSYDLEMTIKKLYPQCPPVKTIYRGIVVDDTGYQIHYKIGAGISFLFLGGLQSYKRLEHGINTKGGITLMEAWKKAEKELSAFGATLYFGGPASDIELFAEWQGGLLFPKAVQLIGMLHPSEVNDYIRKSDIIIIPSMEEGMPNFLLESFVNGRPVIGSDAGGIPEAIVDGETGYIFRKGNYDELAWLLLKTAQEQEKHKDMGRSAYERVKHAFNAAGYSCNVINFYKEIINQCAE